jgi:DNA-binding NarL/FixJ family response regulator
MIFVRGMEIRVIIADDHAMLLEGLKSLLEKKGVTVVATAKNGREARDLAIRLQPDVVIMDISMPGLNGVEATATIRKKIPNTKVIALSMHSNKQSVDKMFASGASGYILKESAFDELYDAIQKVKNDQFYLTPSIGRLYVDKQGKLLKDISKRSKFKKISRKEREVLQLVAEGQRNRAIAEKLGLSIKTVEAHRRNIMKKLGIFSVAGLTKFAIKEGIVSLE